MITDSLTSSLPVPRVVIKNKTRYALVIHEAHDYTHVLTREDGIWDIARRPTKSVGREYEETDSQQFVGKVAPTVEHFFDVIAKSTLEFTPIAIQLLQEMNTMKTLIINNLGKIIAVANPQSVILTDDKPVADNVVKVTAKIGVRAIAAFVTAQLALPNPLGTIKKDDARIGEAITIAFANSGVEVKAAAAAKTAATKAAAKPAAAKAAGAKAADKEPRKPGTKQVVHDHLVAGNLATFEALVKLSGSTDSSVRTALTDLKNPKYALNGKAIEIEKNAAGEYFVPTPATKAAAKKAADAAAAAEAKAKADADKIAAKAAKDAAAAAAAAAKAAAAAAKTAKK